MNSTEQNGPERGGAVEERVSTVVGDRLCVKCGFNLFGQTIVREPRYGLLIVRCPECATVAALQEYPLLGKWANRWASTLAGLWFFVLLMWLVGFSGAGFGLTMGGLEEGAGPFATALGDASAAAAATVGPQGPQTGFWQGSSQWNTVDRDWVAAQDMGAIFNASGGWGAVVETGALVFWMVQWLVLVPFGLLLSLALLHLRRWRLLVAPLLMMVIMGAFSLIAWIGLNYEANQFARAADVARERLAGPLMAVGALNAASAVTAGLLLGRPVARGLVRLLLGPRMRNSFARLWIADVLAAPTEPKGRGS